MPFDYQRLTSHDHTPPVCDAPEDREELEAAAATYDALRDGTHYAGVPRSGFAPASRPLTVTLSVLQWRRVRDYTGAKEAAEIAVWFRIKRAIEGRPAGQDVAIDFHDDAERDAFYHAEMRSRG